MTREKATPPDDRFLNTFGVCRPCHDQQALWARWHNQYGVPWEQDGLGYCATIGTIDKRPIAVTVFWVNIAGRRVAFVEGTSQLVDYRMIDDWCEDVFPNASAFANQDNFHNIIHPIADAIGVKSILARSHTHDLHAKYALKNPDFMRPNGPMKQDMVYKTIIRKDLPKPKDNLGWKQKLLSVDWHDCCLDGYPGWEMETADGKSAPAFVKLTHIRATKDVESSTLANKWDDIANEPFYTRDWTDDGIPFVNKGDTYWSGWWFKTVVERDRFVVWQEGSDL
jgi:hypothetical protein